MKMNTTTLGVIDHNVKARMGAYESLLDLLFAGTVGLPYAHRRVLQLREEHPWPSWDQKHPVAALKKEALQ